MQKGDAEHCKHGYGETYQLDWIGQSSVGLCVSVH